MSADVKISELTDLELCLALAEDKNKSEQAFTEIYNRYSQKLFSFILRMTNNRTDTKDIFQEVLIRFYDSCRKGTKATNILPYLLRIARNLCLNHIRDKKTTVSFDETLGLLNFELDVEKSDFAEVISIALSNLDVLSREIFVLHHYQNLTFNEISELLGETLATVKSRYYRGKEKLKTFLYPYFKNEYK